MIRIVLADDHAIMRGGLKEVLARVPEFELIGEATNGNELLGLLRQKMPDVLLTDLSMPGLSGYDLIESIKSFHPMLRILVLTMHNDPQMATRIIKLGAEGYLTKDRSPAELIAAIRKVADGGKCIDQTLAEKILFNSSSETLHSQLSNRELDVLRLLLKGDSVNHISEQLCISNKTVSSHKSTILRKMGMSSTTELVRYAMQHELFGDIATQ